MLLGVHCSISGGTWNAFDEAEKLGIDTFQIFTRNQKQWKAKPVEEEEMSAFRNRKTETGMNYLFSHCSYLLNLASEAPQIRHASRKGLTEEVERCTALGLHYCVLHPGAAGTQTQDEAIQKIAKGLNEVIAATPDSGVVILLENTAGQGTSVGGPFQNLSQIRSMVERPDRVGFCFDTCHAFVAGYDIRTRDGVEDTMAEFEKHCGLDNLKAFHFNDSKGDLNSHLDRHENIGKGYLGLEPFRYILNRFKDRPKVLETPKEDNMDEVNLKVLREMAA